jgi:hypothetical protein
VPRLIGGDYLAVVGRELGVTKGPAAVGRRKIHDLSRVARRARQVVDSAVGWRDDLGLKSQVKPAGEMAELIGSSDIPIFIFSYTKPAPSRVRILEELGVPWCTSAARAARGLAALVTEARTDGA